MSCYTYLVRCRDESLYCGWTTCLDRRIKAHNDGKGAKYTKSRRPVELVYYEEFSTREEAMRREWAIKRMTRAQKLKLVRENVKSGSFSEWKNHDENSIKITKTCVKKKTE